MIEQMKQWLDALEIAAPEVEHSYGPGSPESESCDAAIESLKAAIDAVEKAPVSACRSDGRCQYAIDHGAEGMEICPHLGECVMATVEKSE